MYDTIKQIASECGIEVSVFGSDTKVVVTMADATVVPERFDEAVKAAGYKVSYASGECVVSEIN